MAINYTNVFEDLGKIVRASDEIRLSALSGAVATGLSGAITNVSAADPAVVTSTGHNLSTGDKVWIDGVGGAVAVNDSEHVVTVLTANTFQLDREDGTATPPYTSGGIWFRMKTGMALDALYTEIETVMQANGSQELLDGLFASFEGFKDSVIGMVTTLESKATEILTDPKTILDEINGIGTGTSLAVVLPELMRDMNSNSETVQANVVTISSVTADSGNVGNGTVLTDKVLDGVSAPGNGLTAVRWYKGLDSELSPTSDTITLTCSQDNPSDSTGSGKETFSLVTQNTEQSDRLDWHPEGARENTTMRASEYGSKLSNGTMESFSGNVPVGWDLDNGTAGTHVLSESSTVYRGNTALRLSGDGAQATIGISQSIAASQFVPRKKYLVAAYVQGESSTANGTLTISFAGTGYTASSSEKIEMNAAALSAQTSYGLEYFWIIMPDSIPSDWELKVEVTGTLTNAKNVYVDSISLIEATWAAGISLAIVPGSTDFIRSDRFTIPISNDDFGYFQTYMRRAFGYQLPSATSSPSIDDSFAY